MQKQETTLKKILLFILMAISVNSCDFGDDKADAYGNFEATEITVSSEVEGKLLFFNVEEGQEIKYGKIVGLIDTTQLYLRREILKSQKEAIKSKVNNVFSQIAVLNEQKDMATRDKKRIEFLLKDSAATQKEVDDINSRINIIEKQILSIESQNSTIVNEVKALESQIAQSEDMLKKCNIKNPENGTVLNKYIEESEIVRPGTPLYKIADVSTLTLRVYLSSDQLNNLKLGQIVKVMIDKDKENNRIMEGKVSWISPKAEFTPKIIQTKEERTNLVYPVKIRVKNDGYLKIGMPGEMLLEKYIEPAN